MANQTQAYKRSLTGSVGAGMGSLFNGGGKTYFVLEHKVSSKYHRAGEAQEIIVDQVELGRDSACAVRFDESFKTVSRRHAAIVRDGSNWKLVQLSTTNTTFLNGHPVQKEWYLQNGDEIQLSVNGPKLGFIIPTGNKSTVGSIGLSRRLSLFRQQALRPYKTAMYVMSAVIVLLICGGVGYGYWDHKNDLMRAEMSKQELAAVKEQAEKDLASMQFRLDSVSADYSNIKDKLAKLEKARKSSTKTGGGTVYPIDVDAETAKLIATLEPNVYYVVMSKIVLEFDGESYAIEDVGSGTGFLLNDGRFITARHVVEPWCYPSNENDEAVFAMNIVANNGGSVTCYLEAYSPNGTVLKFTSTNAKIDRSSDEVYPTENGNIILPTDRSLDYAIFKPGKKGVLKYDDNLSASLPVQAKLMVLGYPMGLGASSPSDTHPLYSEAVVAKEGLDHGLILTTATTFEHGNSGGPVFAITNDGDAYVVGIVSAGAGRSTGIVVPMATIK